jgi:CRP/FNR family transcriptional regulator, cyclic AMP receptor protein
VRWGLLAGVPDEEVRELVRIARRRTFARNEVVFHHDDPADSLHLIEKGRFAISVMTPLGETATIALRGPGEWFGEMALVSEGRRRSATVVALEDAETFAVYQADFDRLRRQRPQVDQVVIAFLANEVRTLSDRLLEALYLPVERRVLRRLVELATFYGEGEGGIPIPLTQEAIGSLAGTSRATVNRVLREEEARGTVELQRGRTTVLDLETLKRRGR